MTQTIQDRSDDPLSYVLREFQDCSDMVHRSFTEIGSDVVYFPHLLDTVILNRDVLEPLSHVREHEVELLLKQTPYIETSAPKDIVIGILQGSVAVFHRSRVFLVDAYGPEARSVESSENESVITGPHDSFVEMALTNISLIRRRIKSPHLKVVRYGVGEVTKADVYILYINDIANQEYVDELTRRIQDIEIDAVYDANMLVQIIDDRPRSIFPLFLTTERPDVALSKLMAGRVLLLFDNSPSAVSTPAAFFEFLSSPDDYYQRWAVGTALRLLRFIALLITVTFTAFYVSVTTFHYEMIPEALLRTLAESRSRVPFPPVYEALLMEFMIELLREAGARLPTKIGQTIGIVGGIVIGQAAVEAGLTSNVLIIAVASSAIASFVIPSYVMSASIRIVRFGLIVLAGIWGNMGLMMGVSLIVIHLAGLTSLNSSYMSPVSPMDGKDWKDVFVRLPFSALKTRPSQTRTPNPVRQKIRK